MRLADVITEYDRLNVAETRDNSDDYWEFVVYNQDLSGWTVLLTESLGTAAKPAGKKPSRDNLRLTEEWGEIRAEQTLFAKNFTETLVIAMFWPWQDNNHTTLKITMTKAADLGDSEPAPGRKKGLWALLTGTSQRCQSIWQGLFQTG